MTAAPPPGGKRKPPPPSIWDYDAMVENFGFSDSQLQRLWLALLRDPDFLPACLGDDGDADGAGAETTTPTASPLPPLCFTARPCQRALDGLRPPLPKRLRALLESGTDGPSDAASAVPPAPPPAAMTARAALVRRSARGDAVKLLVRLADGLEVETVVMAYGMPAAAAAAVAEVGGTAPEQQQQQQQQQEQQQQQQQQEQGVAGETRPGDRADADADADADGDADADAQSEQQRPQQQPPPPPAAAPAPGRRRTRDGVRTALCFSSQYGCRLGCVFCATGRMGVGANLSAGEIVEQAVLARAACLRFGLPAPASALAMGQGEPVCGGNYAAVVSAVRSLTHPARGFALARRRVTLSTVGAVPARIVDLARDLPGVSLALSLHAPDQALRERLVPSARAAPLPRLLAAVDAYSRHTKQRVFVEYVLLAGLNDGAREARALRELLQGRDVVVNAIPWNPVLAAEGGGDGRGPVFAAPSAAAVAAFHAEVRLGGRGVPCTVRQERGQDIEGACGQLVTAVARQRTKAAAEGAGGAAGGCGGGGGSRCGGGGGGKGETAGGGGGGDVEDAARSRRAGGEDPGHGGSGEQREQHEQQQEQPERPSLWRRLVGLGV